ncbi:hypothetical protein Mal4_00590 [Maioricimonas rarisocia]|uniref:Uncharacterized protein n=1 Tax=Maioricimonas rarisocia TaxID=2528026 RepID=A0A517YZX2_9PLAN|nr:hypothetical protein Mal4_00590 [Maioricimonas rarisocia]
MTHKRKMIRLTASKQVLEYLKRTRRETDRLPARQRQILDACSRSTHKVPRSIGTRSDGPGETEAAANS